MYEIDFLFQFYAGGVRRGFRPPTAGATLYRPKGASPRRRRTVGKNRRRQSLNTSYTISQYIQPIISRYILYNLSIHPIHNLRQVLPTVPSNGGAKPPLVYRAKLPPLGGGTPRATAVGGRIPPPIVVSAAESPKATQQTRIGITNHKQ